MLLTGGCAMRGGRSVGYLADSYMPSAAAPGASAPLPHHPIHRSGSLRRQVVVGPNGRSYELRWHKTSESVGKTSAGSLYGPTRLPRRGKGYRHIGDDPYGTSEAVAYLQFAAWAVTLKHPKTVPVVIGDLSAKGGGRLRPHRSHQSGRDADVGLYRTGNRRLKWFRALPASELDVGKTWTLIEALLRTGAVKYIFLDRSIQQQLAAYASRLGWTDAALAQVFQYPGGNRRALIQHVSGHRNHLHVRFVCSPEDSRCE